MTCIQYEIQITIVFGDIHSMEGEAEGIVGTVQNIKIKAD